MTNHNCPYINTCRDCSNTTAYGICDTYRLLIKRHSLDKSEEEHTQDIVNRVVRLNSLEHFTGKTVPQQGDMETLIEEVE